MRDKGAFPLCLCQGVQYTHNGRLPDVNYMQEIKTKQAFSAEHTHTHIYKFSKHSCYTQCNKKVLSMHFMVHIKGGKVDRHTSPWSAAGHEERSEMNSRVVDAVLDLWESGGEAACHEWQPSLHRRKTGVSVVLDCPRHAPTVYSHRLKDIRHRQEPGFLVFMAASSAVPFLLACRSGFLALLLRFFFFPDACATRVSRVTLLFFPRLYLRCLKSVLATSLSSSLIRITWQSGFLQIRYILR